MDPSRSEEDLARLRSAELEVIGLLAGASNHTLLVRVRASAGEPAGGERRVGSDERLAVYKPQRGERPLWDFPSGTLYRREVAAYEVSRYLGWDLVPPTVARDGPLGIGSVQQFVVHDPQQHYFTLVEDPRLHRRLAQLATFDLLINNADRKGGHVLRTMDGERVVGIDHGLTFHVQPKLRTVVWDLGGAVIAPSWRDDLARLGAALADDSADVACLREFLDSGEIAVLRRRAELLARSDTLPDVAPDRRPYPWPPL